MRKIKQKVAAALLAYAAWITFKCPCAKAVSCHLPHYFLSVLGSVAIVAHDNM